MASQGLITIRLLGPPEVEVDQREAKPSLGRKTLALLAYLAATRRPHRRPHLATLFCQNAADPAGALRWHLSRLRKALGADAIETADDHIQLQIGEGALDLTQFERVLDGDLSTWDDDTLADTVALYRDEFLAGLTLPDAAEFELWLLGERTRFQNLYERGLAALIQRDIASEEYESARAWAQQLVQTNPLLEEAHARLIWLYAKTGNRDAAIEQFEYCRDLLARELAVAPTSELQALYAEVLSGELSHSAPGRPMAVGTTEDLHPSADFVGREAEVTQLLQAWQASLRSQGTVVLLEAEAGGGKTRLAHELAHALPEADFLAGECYESARTIPYYPWIELLERRLAALDDAALKQLPAFWIDYLMRLLPSLARRLGRDIPATPPTASGEVDRLFTAVAEFLLQSSDDAHPLIFIDNLQWADAASLQLFHFVARRAETSPGMLMGTLRPGEAADREALQTLLDDLHRGRLLRLQLQPLSLEAITDLTASLWPKLPQGYRPHVCAMLAQATGGNPLFVTEVLNELAHTTEMPESVPVPASVRDLIRRRLRRLPESGRQVIEAMSVVGAPTTPTQAQQISARSEEETIAAIDLGLRRGLLKSPAAPDHYEFGHDLVREAVAGQLSGIRRRLLHRRAAITLERSEARPATLAYHWQMAGDPEKEGHYAALAGEAAAAVYANDDAMRYLERALGLTPDVQRRIDLLIKLGDVQHLTGRWDEAEGSYRQVLDLAEEAGAPASQALAQNRIGHLLVYKGDFADALICLEQARTTLEALADQQDLLGQVVGEIGIVYWYQGEYDRALELMDQRRRLAEESGDQRGASIAIANTGIVHWSRGDYEQALACYEQKLRIDAELDDRLSMSKAIGNMGIVYRDQGDYARAMSALARKLQIDTELGDRLGMSIALENMGEIYRRQGTFDAAIACCEKSLQIATELGNRQGISTAIGNMAESYAALDRPRLAERLFDQAIALARVLNLRRNLCGYLHGRAKLHVRRQQYSAAQPLNDEALALAEQVARKDIQLAAHLLAIRVRVALSQLEVPAATKQLLTLLDDWTEDSEHAAIHHTTWQLDSSQTSHRQRAADLYRNLYAQIANIEYRRRYEELTSETLPDPSPLPAPPEIATRDPIDLEALLTQVDQIIAELNDS